jgi:hypothetical protein
MVDKAPLKRIRSITIPPVGLEGLLGLPTQAKGTVLFAHGSGSGRRYETARRRRNPPRQHGRQ